MIALRPLARYATPRLLRNYLSGRLLYRPAPIWLDFRLTNRCNHRCVYCDIPNDRAPDLTTAEVKAVIDKTRHVCNWVLLTGGECLLREDIGEIVDYVKTTTDLVLVLNTNMFLLREAFERVRRADVIFFSIDGRPETHDAYRHQGSHARIVDALELLARGQGARPSLLSLTVLHKHTQIEDLEHVLRLSERYGFGPNFLLIRHYPFSRNSRALDAHDAHGISLLDYLLEQKRAGRFMTNTSRGLRVLREVATGVNALPCYSGRLFCYVTNTGSVALCFSRPQDPRYLCLRDPEVSFESALARLAQIRPTKERCAGCTCTTPIELAAFSLDPRTIREVLSTFTPRRPA
jgi:MoaA/NifB/PqqE/SkfB family radical SAM enzyme